VRIPPFKIERFFARWEFAVEFMLSGSDCESLAVAELLELEPGARDRLERLRLGYTETPGAPALRAEIAGLYETIRPDEVLVMSGAEEAIYLFMQATLAAGDRVVVHTPCYQSLTELPRAIGCEVVPWRGDSARGFALDPADLERRLEPGTRVVVLNTPHNPTGHMMSREAQAAVVVLARSRGVTLFSDEVYRELEHDPAARLPAACDLEPSAVSLGVMSKAYGLPGLRIGWIATHDRALLRRVAELKDYTTICAAAPSELMAEIALRQRASIVRRNLGIIRDNLARLDDFFARRRDRFEWSAPDAGPVGFPRLLGEDVEAFCERLAREASVLLLPGTVFDDAENRFRIGFGRRNLPQALARLDEFLG